MSIKKASLSDLPTEILSIICLKLVNVIDYARFGAVCKPWRDIVWQIRDKIPPQLPLLMFPNSSYNHSTGRYKHSFYSLSVGRKLIINDEVSTLKQFRYCYGSSHGWLITVDFCNKIQLLNLFQSDNNVINLPYLKPLQNKSFEIKNGVLSHNPSQTSEYVVMLVCRREDELNSGYLLAFLKPGNRYWNCVSVQKEFEYLTDIIYYKNRVYGISGSGEVVFCDINSTQPSLQRVAPLPLAHVSEGYYYANFKVSLVESSGDLLCVVRTIKLSDYSWKDGFQIYKLQTKRWDWIELNTLGGFALFIAFKGDSTSLLASDFRHCKANHIYFTHYDSPCNYDSCRRLDVRVFNLADASCETLHSESTHKNVIEHLWVQPVLNMVRNYRIRIQSPLCIS